MNISLTEELEAYVKTQVDSGLFSSASEVVREALRTKKLGDMERQLVRRLDLSRVQYTEGKSRVANAEFFDNKIAGIREKHSV